MPAPRVPLHLRPMTNATPAALRGELLHCRAHRAMRWALLALLLSLPAFLFIEPLWQRIAAMGAPALLFSSLLLGMTLAAGPVAALACSLYALYLRVEARFAPRERSRPLGDALALGAGLVVSFLPALAALYPPIKALFTGYIAFRGLGQQYPLDVDPLGFWKAVFFWFIGAATLAGLAIAYWRSHWQKA